MRTHSHRNTGRATGTLRRTQSANTHALRLTLPAKGERRALYVCARDDGDRRAWLRALRLATAPACAVPRLEAALSACVKRREREILELRRELKLLASRTPQGPRGMQQIKGPVD